MSAAGWRRGRVMRLLSTFLAVLAATATLAEAAQPVSPLRRDEQLVFYPTYARRTADGAGWLVRIHGRVFEPEERSLVRGALLAAVSRSVDVRPEQTATLRARLRPFLYDNERGKRIVVRLAGRAWELPPSGADGHFVGELELTEAALDDAFLAVARNRAWIGFSAVLPPGDSRSFAGRVQCLEPQGLSVVSDIDDTLKITGVIDPRAALVATLLEPFRPVEGMPELYARLASRGAALHYVSGTPWQLWPFLEEFGRTHQVPAGSVHLRRLRVWDGSAAALLGPTAEFKRPEIERLLNEFPRRRFVLIGDSGEGDPELFGDLARERPGQVAFVAIRLVRENDDEQARLERAFRDVPAVRWRAFRTADELAALPEMLFPEDTDDD